MKPINDNFVRHVQSNKLSFFPNRQTFLENNGEKPPVGAERKGMENETPAQVDQKMAKYLKDLEGGSEIEQETANIIRKKAKEIEERKAKIDPNETAQKGLLIVQHGLAAYVGADEAAQAAGSGGVAQLSGPTGDTPIVQPIFKDRITDAVESTPPANIETARMANYPDLDPRFSAQIKAAREENPQQTRFYIQNNGKILNWILHTENGNSYVELGNPRVLTYPSYPAEVLAAIENPYSEDTVVAGGLVWEIKNNQATPQTKYNIFLNKK